MNEKINSGFSIEIYQVLSLPLFALLAENDCRPISVYQRKINESSTWLFCGFAIESSPSALWSHLSRSSTY